MSKGAGCGQSPQTGGLPRPQMPPANVCAAAGPGGVRAPRPTVARVVATVRFVGSFRKVCRGGIYPAREPRAAIGTPGFAPRLKYTPNRPPCQRGRERRSGDCPAPKCRPREPAQSGIAPRQTTAPGGPTKTRAPFRQRHFKAKQSLRPRFARPPPFGKGGQTRRRKVPGPLQFLPARRYSSPSPCRMARMVSRSAAVAGSIGGAQNGCIGTPRSAIACLMVGTNCGATS